MAAERLPPPKSISPLNVELWSYYLVDSAYEDTSYILDGIFNGFSLGVIDGETSSAKRNCPSAYSMPETIDKYLEKELAEGTVAGPFSQPPFENTHLNRFGVIPKSQPGEWRLITDLSFPKGRSVNDLIPDCNSTVSYEGIPEAITAIMRVGQGAMLAKFDIKRAYRLLPVSENHRRFLGMFWKGFFYIDLALPFGLRSAPKIFTRFADALQWICSKEGDIAYIQHYLDDFLLIGPAGSDKCKVDLAKCLDLCSQLGVPIAKEKTVGPTTKLTFLGFELDSIGQELRLPVSKIVRVREALSVWTTRRSGTQRELLALVGLLQHCCQALVHARPFLRRLINKAHSVSELHYHIDLSSWERDDLKWWSKLLRCWNGKSLFFFPTWECAPDVSITSDAAGSMGFAAVMGSSWFAGKWPSESHTLSIAVKELIPIVLAAHIWGHEWSRKRILFKCDNQAVVSCLKYGSCRDRHLAFLLRDLAIKAITSSFTYSAVHIPGCRNQQADALSRFQFQKFFQDAPDAATTSLQVPDALLKQLVFPPWIKHGKNC